MKARWEYVPSALAAGAPDGGALADRGLLHPPAAFRAGFAASAVGHELQVEVAGLAVGIDEIPERGAAALDGVAKDAFHHDDERFVACPRDLAGFAEGMDAG